MPGHRTRHRSRVRPVPAYHHTEVEGAASVRPGGGLSTARAPGSPGTGVATFRRAWPDDRLRRTRAFGEAMRPWWVESGHPLPKTPRQKWIETKESWERSRHIEVPAPIPAAPPRPGGLRVAFLIYRGNPRCGGQGVYTRHLTRELVALGPLGRGLRRARPGPSSTRASGSRPCRASTSTAIPTRSGSRTGASSPRREDWLEFAIMCTAGFGEPLAFSLRARQLLAAAPRRVRRRARQPVPRHRHARHGRGRVAAADHAAPPDHGGPPARAVAHDQPVAALHARAAGSASSACRCGWRGRSPPW